jgi:hypothetical protein
MQTLRFDKPGKPDLFRKGDYDGRSLNHRNTAVYSYSGKLLNHATRPVNGDFRDLATLAETEVQQHFILRIMMVPAIQLSDLAETVRGDDFH